MKEKLSEYLKAKKFENTTVFINIRYAEIFIKWLESENNNIENCVYKDIINFIEYLKTKGKSIRNINQYLLAIRHLYASLEMENAPANDVRLKGERRTVPMNLLDDNELNELYDKYYAFDNRTKRNKSILSLLIHQALTTEDLHNLKPEHLKLKQGKIIVPKTKRTNSRTLTLLPEQIILLQEYSDKIRAEIISQNPINTEQLFISITGKTDIKNSLYHLFRALKQINQNVRNAKQIRMSVIRNKLKNSNLREVQQFAGHKWVSSTERYLLNNIDDLQRDIEKYHPMKNIE